MPRYIRAFIPGGTFFFTVALLERRRRLLTEHIGELRVAFIAARSRKPFAMNAIVVLPDRLHCLWTLLAGDADFSSRWQAIKARFARAIPAGEQLSPRRQKKGERGIWQRRFWEHVICDLNLNNATGGMRCAFPPYRLLGTLNNLLIERDFMPIMQLRLASYA